MPFVKLDCGILNSTLWLEREAREVFITALLMAEPYEATTPMPQLQVHALDETGFIVPPGWYGFVPAAGVGIVHRAGLAQDRGLAALERLGNPEESSRSPEFGGRRLVRVDGGYIVLNFFKYRDRDYTTAERSRRYRERLASRRGDTKSRVTARKNVARTRDITQAEAEAEAEAKKKEKDASLSPAAPILKKPKKPDAFLDASITERAGRFIDRYQELYREHRKGARYLVRPVLDYQAAVELCTTWTDDARLEQIATIFLLTDHKFAEEGSRTIPQFKALASWCDSRLAEHEASHARP